MFSTTGGSKDRGEAKLPTILSRPSPYCRTKSSEPPWLRVSDGDLPRKARRGHGETSLIGGKNGAAAVRMWYNSFVVRAPSLQVH